MIFLIPAQWELQKNEVGKTYYVPADMSYRDWEKKLVVQKPKGKSSGKGNDLSKKIA